MKTAKQILTICNKLHKYGCSPQHEDIYLADDEAFLSTRKVAELLRVSHHTFSNQYAKPLMRSGIRRLSLGRSKFYCLEEILEILSSAIKTGKTVFDTIHGRKKSKKKN